MEGLGARVMRLEEEEKKEEEEEEVVVVVEEERDRDVVLVGTGVQRCQLTKWLLHQVTQLHGMTRKRGHTTTGTQQ